MKSLEKSAVDKRVLTFGFSSVYTHNAYGEVFAGGRAADGVSPKGSSRFPSSDRADIRHTTMDDQNLQKEQRALLAKLEKEGLAFERWLITLATGTVVLSVSFLNGAEHTGHWALLASWITLVLSITAGLVDRLLYIYSLSSHPLLDESAQHNPEKPTHYLIWSERVSWIQIVTFFLGIASLLIFAIISAST